MQDNNIWQPIETGPKNIPKTEGIWLSNKTEMWLGYWDGQCWFDRQENEHDYIDGPRHRVPMFWRLRLPKNYVPLPEEIDHAGKQFETAVGYKRLPAQGLMWVHDGERWQHLLVVPEGIPKVEERVADIFKRRMVSQAMVLEDVKVVGPTNYMFQILVKLAKGNFNSRVEFRGPEVFGSHITDDGTPLRFWFRPNAVVYRALKTVDGSDFKRPSPLPALQDGSALGESAHQGI